MHGRLLHYAAPDYYSQPIKNTIAAVSRPSHYYLIQNTDPSQNELCEQALYRAWLLSAMHLILASATLSFC